MQAYDNTRQQHGIATLNGLCEWQLTTSGIEGRCWPGGESGGSVGCVGGRGCRTDSTMDPARASVVD